MSEVRSGVGVLAAVQFDPAATEADPTLLGRAIPALRKAGIMTRMLASGAIQVSPPLVLTDPEVDELASGFGAALDDLG